MGRIYYKPGGNRVLVSVHVKQDDKEQRGVTSHGFAHSDWPVRYSGTRRPPRRALGALCGPVRCAQPTGNHHVYGRLPLAS